MTPVVLAAHVLAAVLWVGGMFFAYAVLRPASNEVLEPPLPARLWGAVLGRFLAWVWAAAGTLLATGYAMVAAYGGFAIVGWHVHAMHALAWVMVALLLVLTIGPFRRLRAALAASQPSGAAAALAVVRRIVAVNLTIGCVVVAIAAGGRLT